jgi:FMN phosphatase YigB (HAD superfamily)
VSHSHASQHIRAQKQGDTRSLVRSTGKPQPLFWRLLLAAADCPPHQVLMAGNSLINDVIPALEAGMHAVLVRPDGLAPWEELPDGAVLVRHVEELPALIRKGTS